MKTLATILSLLLAFPVLAGQNPYGILELEGYGNSDSSGITSKRGRNDFTIKETLASGDNLFFIKGYGYNGTAFGTNAAASIEFQANQAWTAGANGTKIVFKTTPSGSTTPATALQLNGTGILITPPAAQTIASGGTITADACGTIKRITNPSAVTTDTTNTFTAPAATNTGCVMFLVNVGTSTITLDNNALFVSAGGANVAVTADDALTVASDGSKWYQISALLAN